MVLEWMICSVFAHFISAPACSDQQQCVITSRAPRKGGPVLNNKAAQCLQLLFWCPSLSAVRGRGTLEGRRAAALFSLFHIFSTIYINKFWRKCFSQICMSAPIDERQFLCRKANNAKSLFFLLLVNATAHIVRMSIMRAGSATVLLMRVVCICVCGWESLIQGFQGWDNEICKHATRTAISRASLSRHQVERRK